MIKEVLDDLKIFLSIFPACFLIPSQIDNMVSGCMQCDNSSSEGPINGVLEHWRQICTPFFRLWLSGFLWVLG